MSLFCCKKLHSFEWLRTKKTAIFNNDKNVLNDALNYQNIEKDPRKIPKIRPYISKCNY